MKKLIIVLLMIVTTLAGFSQAVGIGTNSPHPSAQLDVSSTTKGLLVPRMTLAQRGAIPSPAAGLLIYQTDNTPGYYSYNGSFWAFASNYWISAFGSNIFYGDGNVSIGSTANFGTFNVTGSQAIYGDLPLLLFRPQPSATTSQVRFQLSDGSNEFGLTHFNNRVYLSRMLGNNIANDVILLNNGNLGIGVSTPNAKLHVGTSMMVGTGSPATGYILSVNGKIMSEEVRVELDTDWPDYVFEKTYRLPSLMDLEKFIGTHKHLPNIPAAAQVKNEGFDLGDMNRRLLEKVEELTLYIIEQEKRINEIKKQLDSIQLSRKN